MLLCGADVAFSCVMMELSDDDIVVKMLGAVVSCDVISVEGADVIVESVVKYWTSFVIVVISGADVKAETKRKYIRHLFISCLPSTGF